MYELSLLLDSTCIVQGVQRPSESVFKSRIASLDMPPKKAVPLKKTAEGRATDSSGTPSQTAYVSSGMLRQAVAPSKEVGRSEGAKAPDTSDVSSEPSVCPIRDNAIIDGGEKVVGEDAFYCKVQCNKWFHRCCASLVKHEFFKLKDKEMAYNFAVLCSFREKLLKNYVGRSSFLLCNLTS